MDRSTSHDQLRWRKSRYSGDASNCVELAPSTDGSGAVHVRDSKNPTGPALRFGAGSWASFVRSVKNGDFDR
ncbi:DUF397 domain-containing protein [Bailinhaonella thermotolerans]|uniref:DUF397 domain-containing protein n=1 Tax=Bailinhaonella thermotolerans TaxID=1070861 RepID=A0A3A4A1D4_9ACTN|nr:DUF397 domain-containing protein [Bailinhaonella thermotolerans]RJL21072.1 DUF397 domain-containing protein [Bailinhaonella thermotolerans]